MKTAQLPDGRLVEFPDDVTPEEMTAAVNAQFRTEAANEPPAPEPRDTTFGEAAGGLGLALGSGAMGATKSLVDLVDMVMPKPLEKYTTDPAIDFFQRGIDSAQALKPEAFKAKAAQGFLKRGEDGSVEGLQLPSAEHIGNLVAEMLPYIPSFIAGGGAVSKGVTTLAPKAGKLAADAIGYGTANAALQAPGQFDETYRQAIADGKTEEEAQAAAQEAANLTAALMAVTGGAGGAISSKVGSEAGSLIGALTKGFAAEGPFEGIEETGQSIIQDTSLDKPIDWPAALDAGLSATFLGGAPGASIAGLEYKKPYHVAPGEPAPPAAPIPTEEQVTTQAALDKAIEDAQKIIAGEPVPVVEPVAPVPSPVEVPPVVPPVIPPVVAPEVVPPVQPATVVVPPVAPTAVQPEPVLPQPEPTIVAPKPLQEAVQPVTEPVIPEPPAAELPPTEAYDEVNPPKPAAAPVIPKPPLHLLEHLAASKMKLNLPAFMSEFGLDPADVKNLRPLMHKGKFNTIFTKEGGMKPEGLRDFLMDNGYMVDERVPGEVQDSSINEAYEILSSAIMGGRVVSMDKDAEEAAYQQAEHDAAEMDRPKSQEELMDAWHAGFYEDPGITDEEFDALSDQMWERENSNADQRGIPSDTQEGPGVSVEERSQQGPATEQPAGQPSEKPTEQPSEQPEAKPDAGKADNAKTEPEPTGLKKDLIEAERLGRGKEPLVSALTESHPEVIAEAEKVLADNPDRAAEIVTQLNSSQNDQTTTVDKAVLLIHKVRKMNERDAAAKRASNESLSEEQRQTAHQKWAEAEAEVAMVEQAARTTGTQAGRNLEFMKVLMHRDFSLAAMENKARAVRMRALTFAEQQDIEAQAKTIAELQKKSEELEQALRDAIDNAGAKNTYDLLATKFSDRTAKKKNFVKTINEKADESRAWIKSNLGRANAGVDPTAYYHLIRIGAAHVVNGAVKLADWIRAMKADVGDKVWSQIEDQAETMHLEAKNKADSDAVEAGEKLAKDIILEARADSAAGEELSHRTVYELARAHILQGVHGEAAVMEAVHKDLEPFFEGLTERDVRRAFSDYGKARFPSQEADKKELAELRVLVRMQESIDRLKAGLPALKTGPQRDKATQKIREKERGLKELMREREARNPESSPERLAGINEARLTALKNRIADLEKEIATGEKRQKASPVEATPEVKALQERRAKLQAELDAIEAAKNPPKSEQQKKIEARVKSLEEQIKLLELELTVGKRMGKAKPKSVVSAEITKLQERRDTLADQLKAMEKAAKVKKSREEVVNKARETRLKKQIEELTAELETGAKPAEKAEVAPTQNVTDLKAFRDALKEKLRLIEEAKNPPPTAEEQYNKTRGAQLRRALKEIQDRIAKGDYAKRPRLPKPELTKENQEVALKLHEAKSRFIAKQYEWELEQASKVRKAMRFTGRLLSFSRSLKTSLDVSVFGRQAAFALLAHPKLLTPGTVNATFEAMKSEASAHSFNQEILNHPRTAYARKMGLFLNEQDHAKLSQREEVYMDNWVKKTPGVAVSARMYSTALNATRITYFNYLVDTLGRNGKVTEEEAKHLARLVNNATGRGNLGNFSSTGITQIFFAPRWVMSRFSMLAGLVSPTGHIFGAPSPRLKRLVAAEYLRASSGLLALMSLVGSAFALTAGDDEEAKPQVDLDPKSTDFMKLKIGKTRIDMTAALAQPIVFLARVLGGEKTTATGKEVPLRGEDVPYGGDDTWDIIGRFIRSKLAPPIAAGINTLAGKDVVGQDTNAAKELAGLAVPLSLADMYAALKEQGIPRGMAIQFLSTLGFAANTYADREKKKDEKKRGPRKPKPRVRVERER